MRATFSLRPARVRRSLIRAGSRPSSGLAADRVEAAAAECRPAFAGGSTPAWLAQELRSNHAGETGAVWIYRGARAALCLRRGAAARPAWAELARVVDEHEAHEAQHLGYMEHVVPARHRSALLPVWVAAGFALGLLPALVSPRAFYLTTEGVEAFVEDHYGAQIRRLRDGEAGPGRFGALLALLEHCCAEEVAHKDDAAARAAAGAPLAAPAALLARAWRQVVFRGSQAAVVAAKRV